VQINLELAGMWFKIKRMKEWIRHMAAKTQGIRTGKKLNSF
jgi:hypothetical protein